MFFLLKIVLVAQQKQNPRDPADACHNAVCQIDLQMESVGFDEIIQRKEKDEAKGGVQQQLHELPDGLGEDHEKDNNQYNADAGDSKNGNVVFQVIQNDIHKNSFEREILPG